MACSSVSRMVLSGCTRWRGSAISAISGATSFAGQARSIRLVARGRGIGRGADHRDHLVDVGDRDRETDQRMAAVARLGELVARAPRHDLFAEQHEGGDHVLQVHAAPAGRRSAPAC